MCLRRNGDGQGLGSIPDSGDPMRDSAYEGRKCFKTMHLRKNRMDHARLAPPTQRRKWTAFSRVEGQRVA